MAASMSSMMKSNQMKLFLAFICMGISISMATDASSNVQDYSMYERNLTGPVLLTFIPPSIELLQGNNEEILMNISTTFPPPLKLMIFCDAPKRAEVVDGSIELNIDDVGEMEMTKNGTLYTWYTSFSIQATSLARTTLTVQLHDGSTSDVLYTVNEAYEVVVQRRIDAAYYAFNYILVILLMVNGLGFGCEFDFQIAKEIFKKPTPLVLGFLLQYILMPLLALGLAYATSLPDDLTFGLLTIGCSPGGGLSNIFTLFMGGDLTLSMCLTLISNIMSIGMMPMWMLTLGNLIIPNTIAIPYLNIVISLIVLMSPVAIGATIKHFSPKAGIFFQKALRVCAGLILLFIVTLGVYANLYALEFLHDWKVAVCGMLLPWAGMLATAGVALLAKQPYPRVKTLAIETAIQNSSLALVLLRNTLDQPEADITSVMPISVVTFGPAPFIIYSFVRVMNIFIKSRGKQDEPELQMDDAIVSIAEMTNNQVEGTKTDPMDETNRSEVRGSHSEEEAEKF